MCRISDNAVSAILKMGKLYEVGGAVRDKMLGRDITIKDRDYLVCGIPYLDLSKILKQYGQVDLVGKSFGVIKFTQYRKDNKYTFDLSLPRKEFSTGHGHKDFSVTFDPDLDVADDLLRRDFTINAMAVSLETDQLIDPYGGQVDLKNKLIRMVSPNSFPEDPLRMLRAIQFSARFEFEIEPGTYQAIIDNAELIKTVSAERVSEELNKLLTLADRPSIGFRLMHKTGIMNRILPEMEEMVDVDQPGGYHKYDVFEHTMHTIDAAPKSLHIRLAALFHDIAKPRTRRITETKATFYGHESQGARIAKKVLKRLRYSSDVINKVATLTDRHMFVTGVTDKGMRRLIRKVGQDLIFDLLDLRRADVVAQGMGGTTEDVDEFEQNIRDEIDKKPPFSISDLELDGIEIMQMFSLKPSPIVGEILDFLMENVLDEPAYNTKEKLTELTHLFMKNKGNENN
ncbi:MAG: HD domain-containing protein [Candidatus Zixiibacteriota bacterium]